MWTSDRRETVLSSRGLHAVRANCWVAVCLLGIAGCTFEEAPSRATKTARAPGGEASDQAPEVEPPDEDEPDERDVPEAEPLAGRPARNPKPGNRAGTGGASGDAGATAVAGRAAGMAGQRAGTGGMGGAVAGGAGGDSGGAGATAGAGGMMAEGRCDLPACAPQQLRSCYATGVCQIDYESQSEAHVCFENGIELRARGAASGNRLTVFDEDGSTCFIVALDNLSTFNEVGAAYLDADGATIAVAGLRDGTWTFVCNDGTAKRLDGVACGLYSDLPPGIANVQNCEPGACE